MSVFLHSSIVWRDTSPKQHCLWPLMFLCTSGPTQDFACSKRLRTVSPCMCVSACYLQMSNLFYVSLLSQKIQIQNTNITKKTPQTSAALYFYRLSDAQHCCCRLVRLFAQSSSHLSLDLSIHPKIFRPPHTLQQLPWKQFREDMGSRLSAERLCTHLVNLSTDLIGNEMCELL